MQLMKGGSIMAVPSWFDEYTYLQSKLNQLISAGQTQYSNVTQVKAAIEAAGMSVYQHFEKYSLAERTSPNTYFNTQEYLEAKAKQLNTAQGVTTWTADKVALEFQNAGLTNAYEHFSKYGWQEDVNPSNSFDLSSYFDAKAAATGKTVAEVKAAFAAAGLDPIAHYTSYGKGEGIAVTAVPASEQVTPASSSGSTGQTFTLTDAVGENVVGTAGNDTFAAIIDGTADTLNVGDKIDGGNGTDTLNLYLDTGTADETLPLGAAFSNIEILNVISDGTSTLEVGTTASTIDASKLAGVTQLWQANAANDVDKIGSGLTVGLRGDVAFTTQFQFETAAGNIALDGVDDGTTLTVEGKSASVLLETVTVSGSVTTSAANADTNPDDLTINVAGAGNEDVTTINLALTKNTEVDGDAFLTVQTLDASTSTGGVWIDLTNVDGLGGGAGALEVAKFGSGKDNVTIDLGTENTTVDLGAGADKIDIDATAVAGDKNKLNVTLGTGADEVTISAAANIQGLTSATFQNSLVTIEDFSASQDSLDISGVITTMSTQTIVNGALDADKSLFDNLAAVAAAMDGDTAQFVYGDSLYIFIDNGGAGTVNAGDALVKLTGVSSVLVAGDNLIV
jgi:hypothetical protein